jgi:NRAMP (natural resistance-associated macrophage protein)-like metal ion transporter
MNILSKAFYGVARSSKALRLFLALAGPGIIVMVADNDAGGITTYAATGAQFGYNLIWFLVILLPVAYFVQEMTVRLGAVTKRGHAEAIFDAFGSFWGWFSLFDLILTDFLTLITEFIGMTAAFSIFGIPPVLTVVGVILIMGFMVIRGRYWTWEKIALFFCAVNLIYIPAAFMVHPDVGAVLSAGIVPNFPGGFNNNIFFFLMANIGTTIAPWMIFFQQSSVVDKGLQEKDIRMGRLDTLIGSIATVTVAIFIVIVTGTVLKGLPIESAAQASIEISKSQPLVGTFVAIGLFDAGLLGAICISLASSWAFGEVFGWAHSLNKKVHEAPAFYALYFSLLIGAGAIVLIPGAPLVLITLFVQVIAVTLLPAALVFLLLLLNDRDLMGERYRNSTVQNIIVTIIIVLIIVLSTLYAVSAIFPNLFS